VPNASAASAASGWGGDAVTVFASGDRRAVAIRVRFDDEAHARQGFEAVVRGALRAESDGSQTDRPPPFVATATARPATQRGEVCQARPLRGPFAAVRRGRDLGVALGPYRRSGAVTRSDGDCDLSLRWARSIATAK
jgi:hypothetical protein